MKDLILTVLCVVTLMVSGCTKVSHSANLTATGKIFKVGGEAYNLLYVNGLLNMNAVRENAESVVETTDEDGFTGGPTSDAKGVRSIRFRTGPIVSGYLCDLAKTSPEAATEYVKQFPEMNKPYWDTKQTMPEKKAGEKSTSDNYIEMLKEKLKSIAGGKSDGKAVFDKDGTYNNLWEDKTIEKQAALTSELLAKCDDVTEIQEEGELIKTTLIHFTGRLAQLKAAGATESKRICLDRATIKDGKVTFLRYRLTDLKTGETSDEVCPNCYGLETEDN